MACLTPVLRRHLFRPQEISICERLKRILYIIVLICKYSRSFTRIKIKLKMYIVCTNPCGFVRSVWTYVRRSVVLCLPTIKRTPVYCCRIGFRVVWAENKSRPSEMTNATVSINYVGLSPTRGRCWRGGGNGSIVKRINTRCLVKNVKFMTLVFAGKWIKKQQKKKKKKAQNDKIAITRTCLQ